MRALIRSLVEPASSAVYECADGESALELYARVHPDLVLMDVKMGGMDGIATTRALRQSDPGACVVIVTEHQEAHYRSAARAAGASGYFTKDHLLDLPRFLSTAQSATTEQGPE